MLWNVLIGKALSCVCFTAVKFGRMSKKQRDRLYLEVIRHKQLQMQAQNEGQTQYVDGAAAVQQPTPQNGLEPDHVQHVQRYYFFFLVFVDVFVENFEVIIRREVKR